MALQGGGGRVFPSELMITRKTKTGMIFPVFLSDENNDYITSVRDIFYNNIGQKKDIIAAKLKELESTAQNIKIIRALALLYFRHSIFAPPVNVDAEALRDKVFRMARIPPVTPESREIILKEAGKKFDINPDEVIAGLYSDKDSEFILKEPFDLDMWGVAKKYNIEQLETIFMKAKELTITNLSAWNYILTSIKKLGLLYEAEIENKTLSGIKVTGPLQIFENTERYGTRFSQLIRKLAGLEKWEIEGIIRLKDKFDKTTKEYKIKLSDSISYYLPDIKRSEDKNLPEFVRPSEPLFYDNSVYFPDYIMNLNNKNIYINISNKRSLENDNEIAKRMSKNFIWINVVILSQGEKKLNNVYTFQNDIDFYVLKEMLEKKYAENKSLNSELDKNSIDAIKTTVDKLYPDTEKMFEYIESQGLIPERVLPALGYKLKWHGLDIIVLKK